MSDKPDRGQPEPLLEQDIDSEPESVVDQVRELAASARARAETEWAFQTARAGLAGKLAAVVAGLGCLVLMVLFFVLMALVFGAVLGLAQSLGVWKATALVCGGLMLVALLAALFAWRSAVRIAALFGDKDSQS